MKGNIQTTASPRNLLVSEPDVHYDFVIKLFTFILLFYYISFTPIVILNSLKINLSHMQDDDRFDIAYFFLHNLIGIAGFLLLKTLLSDNMKIYENGIVFPNQPFSYIIRKKPYFMDINKIVSVTIDINLYGNIGLIVKHSKKKERMILINFDLQPSDYTLKVLKTLRNNEGWAEKIYINNKSKLKINNIEALIKLIEEKGDIHKLINPNSSIKT